MITESRLIGHNFLLGLLVVMTTMVELTSAWHSMKANVKLASSPGPSLLWPWSWCDFHTIMCACTVWRFSMHVVSSIKSLNVCMNDFHDLRIDGACSNNNGNAEHCGENRRAVPEYRMEYACLHLFENSNILSLGISAWFYFQPLSHKLWTYPWDLPMGLTRCLHTHT